MVIKGKETVEITPNPLEKKRKTPTPYMNRKGARKTKQGDDGTPLRGIFCLKTRQDMKMVEEKEDCFILDFDPNESFDAAEKLSSSSDGDDDVVIIHEKGQVACRDFPHSRHLCSRFPFGSTKHAIHCNKCYCYVCESVAPCAFWTDNDTPHCDAFDDNDWKYIRMFHRELGDQLDAPKK